ncbi:MAG: hypothetical protein M3Z25_02385 [Actinomycetota bacterium]|nr:hypothetical protein [Actinomycetota bacterium]
MIQRIRRALPAPAGKPNKPGAVEFQKTARRIATERGAVQRCPVGFS